MLGSPWMNMTLAKIDQAWTQQTWRNETNKIEFKGPAQTRPKVDLVEPFGWPCRAKRLAWLGLVADLAEPRGWPHLTSLVGLALVLNRPHLAPRLTTYLLGWPPPWLTSLCRAIWLALRLSSSSPSSPRLSSSKPSSSNRVPLAELLYRLASALGRTSPSWPSPGWATEVGPTKNLITKLRITVYKHRLHYLKKDTLYSLYQQSFSTLPF